MDTHKNAIRNQATGANEKINGNEGRLLQQFDAF
ncbi:hypothetical protein FHS68_004512 [Dyadobacter arcticus]|uniref:Uncharacterized protein n=1 Tax=Dyadobacter arcticus TaxID=1078754 RepID=A0ABX0UQQ2_9BACT|nr:hypothetical protein [Dyadobacter arcticus]